MSAWQNNGLPDRPALVLPNRLPQPNPILFELGKNKKVRIDRIEEQKLSVIFTHFVGSKILQWNWRSNPVSEPYFF